jgi:AraC-like DNA-binding protein
MDPLDDALDDLRISGSVLLHEHYTPDWAIDVPDEARMRTLLGVGSDMRVLPFHLVRRGGFDLSSEAETIRLDEPELSLVPGGQAHRLGVGRRARPVPLADILAGGGTTTADAASPHATELICGAFFARAAPLNPLLGALPPMLKVAAGGKGASPALSGVAALLAAELGRQARSGYTAQRLLEVLCAEAIRAFQAQGGDGKAGWLRGLKDPKIAAALREVHARPGHAWTLETLAKLVALSPSRFSARFREHVGDSVMGYVGRWRINVACRLLRHSDLPLTAVAGRIGYDSLPAFSRAFKAQAGIPPAQWRRQQERSTSSSMMAE